MAELKPERSVDSIDTRKTFFRGRLNAMRPAGVERGKARHQPLTGLLMRLHIHALVLAATLPVVAIAQPAALPAASPHTTVTLPDTPIGRLGQQFLDAIDAGDSATVSRFIAL